MAASMRAKEEAPPWPALAVRCVKPRLDYLRTDREARDQRYLCHAEFGYSPRRPMPHPPRPLPTAPLAMLAASVGLASGPHTEITTAALATLPDRAALEKSFGPHWQR